MSAVLPSIALDADATTSRYFLQHQLTWIADDSDLRLAEKSVRIGWTYADAFKNVRKRLRHARRDYLFATRDQPSAFEYIETCKRFLEVFNLTKTILAHGIDDLRVPIYREGKDTGFTEEVRVGYIKFDNGSRILAFSSNPNAMRVYGGDVGLDEFAFHPAPDELWETAQGRVTWGFDLGVWSAHNGTDTLFYQFAQEAQAGKGGWSYYRVTIEDAIELGLVEKINETSGKKQTREEFLEAAKRRARLDEIFQQAYMCNPRGSTSAIVSWSTIELCRKDYAIERVHFEADQVRETFGEFEPTLQASRQTCIRNYLHAAFAQSFDRIGHHALGFDVAASGQGDLAAIYVDEITRPLMRLRALFTCRTDDWDFLKTVLWCFLRELTSVTGAGDETGLGRQICWETQKQFGGQFLPVGFRQEKHNMGFSLMNQLAVVEKQWPHGEADIASDFFALRKINQGGRWIFTEGSNTLNPHSHCDIAWAGALSSKAAVDAPPPGAIKSFTAPGGRNRAKRDREVSA